MRLTIKGDLQSRAANNRVNTIPTFLKSFGLTRPGNCILVYQLWGERFNH